jgi:catechol 2,3-dioxygenase
MAQAPSPIDPRIRIGHVHLKVADLDCALAFYRGVLGFELQQRFGSQAAFISAGGLPSSHRVEHLGEQGRFTAAGP